METSRRKKIQKQKDFFVYIYCMLSLTFSAGFLILNIRHKIWIAKKGAIPYIVGM